MIWFVRFVSNFVAFQFKSHILNCIILITLGWGSLTTVSTLSGFVSKINIAYRILKSSKLQMPELPPALANLMPKVDVGKDGNSVIRIHQSQITAEQLKSLQVCCDSFSTAI